MKRIAQFFKVSFDQFFIDYSNLFPSVTEKEIREMYNRIALPQRATEGSAGYDFFTPVMITLKPKQSIQIPTGIRVKLEPGWMLQCYPKSGHGTKFRLQLDNTVGIIDSDYFYAKNEGHILVKISNDSNEQKTLKFFRTRLFVKGFLLNMELRLMMKLMKKELVVLEVLKNR